MDHGGHRPARLGWIGAEQLGEQPVGRAQDDIRLAGRRGQADDADQRGVGRDGQPAAHLELPLAEEPERVHA